jgi:hypothetical protein
LHAWQPGGRGVGDCNYKTPLPPGHGCNTARVKELRSKSEEEREKIEILNSIRNNAREPFFFSITCHFCVTVKSVVKNEWTVGRVLCNSWRYHPFPPHYVRVFKHARLETLTRFTTLTRYTRFTRLTPFTKFARYTRYTRSARFSEVYQICQIYEIYEIHNTYEIYEICTLRKGYFVGYYIYETLLRATNCVIDITATVS